MDMTAAGMYRSTSASQGSSCSFNNLAQWQRNGSVLWALHLEGAQQLARTRNCVLWEHLAHIRVVQQERGSTQSQHLHMGRIAMLGMKGAG